MEPTWLDFLVADLTWKQPDDKQRLGEQAHDQLPSIRVPPWRHLLAQPNTSEVDTKDRDPNAV